MLVALDGFHWKLLSVVLKESSVWSSKHLSLCWSRNLIHFLFSFQVHLFGACSIVLHCLLSLTAYPLVFNRYLWAVAWCGYLIWNMPIVELQLYIVFGIFCSSLVPAKVLCIIVVFCVLELYWDLLVLHLSFHRETE